MINTLILYFPIPSETTVSFFLTKSNSRFRNQKQKQLKYIYSDFISHPWSVLATLQYIRKSIFYEIGISRGKVYLGWLNVGSGYVVMTIDLIYCEMLMPLW